MAKFITIYIVFVLFSTISCVQKQGIQTQAQIPLIGEIIAEQSPLWLDCEPPWLIEKLRSALGDEKVSCYQIAQIELTAGAKGWLITANFSDSIKTDLIWVVDQAGYISLQKPLNEIGENHRWDFLDIDSISDFDRDGSLEALLIGTGGGGMYFHYPIILRLDAEGNWEILFTPDEPFFYGTTEILPTDSDGGIRLVITSVDYDAPWAFSDCSLCPHPFKREIYSLLNGKLQLSSRSPVASPLATLSEVILAARSNSLAISDGYFSNNATVGGEQIKDQGSLEIALKKIKLSETKGRCYERNEEEKEPLSTVTIQGKKVAVLGGSSSENKVRFECDNGEFWNSISYWYVARVTTEGDRFVILSLDYVEQ